MTYKFELFLVTQKIAHTYKKMAHTINHSKFQTLFSSNFIYRVQYMIRFLLLLLLLLLLWLIYTGLLVFYTELTHLAQKNLD